MCVCVCVCLKIVVGAVGVIGAGVVDGVSFIVPL